MSQEKLQRAATLINQKNYVAAVKLLETMPDEPQAQKWLAEMRKRGYAINHIRQEDEDIWTRLPPPVQMPPSAPVLVTRGSRNNWLFQFFVGMSLIAIIALLAANFIKENEPAKPVTQTLQGWEYMIVERYQVEVFGNDVVDDQVEFVSSNYPEYDTELFGELICTEEYDQYDKCVNKYRGLPYYLNLWGNDGWELINIFLESDYLSSTAVMIFQRPKSN